MKKFIACILLVIIIASATFLGYRTAWFKDWSWFNVESSKNIDSSSSTSSAPSDSGTSSGSTSDTTSSNTSNSTSDSASNSSNNSSDSSDSSEEIESDVISLNNMELKYLNNVGYYELDFNKDYSFDFAFLNDVNVGNLEVTLSCSDYKLVATDIKASIHQHYIEYLGADNIDDLFTDIKINDMLSSFVSGLSLKGNQVKFTTGEFGVRGYRKKAETSNWGESWTLTDKTIFKLSDVRYDDVSDIPERNSFWVQVLDSSDIRFSIINAKLGDIFTDNQEAVDNYFITINISDSISGYSKSLNFRFVEDNFFEGLRSDYSGGYYENY